MTSTGSRRASRGSVVCSQASRAGRLPSSSAVGMIRLRGASRAKISASRVLADHRQRRAGRVERLDQVVDIAADAAAFAGNGGGIEQNPRLRVHRPPLSAGPRPVLVRRAVIDRRVTHSAGRERHERSAADRYGADLA